MSRAAGHRRRSGTRRTRSRQGVPGRAFALAGDDERAALAAAFEHRRRPGCAIRLRRGLVDAVARVTRVGVALGVPLGDELEEPLVVKTLRAATRDDRGAFTLGGGLAAVLLERAEE